MATLVDAARTYLMAQGIVRDPRVAGPLPPAWRMPADGVPAPGEGTGVEVGPTAVIGLIRSDGMPAPRMESEFRRDFLEVWIRTAKWPDAETLYVAIRTALIGATFSRTNWIMGGMRVIESVEWRALGLVDSSTTQGYTALTSVLFQTYAAEHS